MKSKKYDATNDEKLIDILNFNSFREMQEFYPNAIDLSNSNSIDSDTEITYDVVDVEELG